MGKYFKSSRLLAIGIVILDLAIALVSFKYYQTEKEIFKNEKASQLQSIADIKVSQILDWRNERLSDARYLASSKQILEDFKLLAAEPANIQSQSALFNSLNAMFLNGKFESMVALDVEGNYFFSIPENIPAIVSGFHNKVNKKDTSGQIIIGDLNLIGDSVVMMQIVVPVINIVAIDTVLMGWLLLNITSEKHLFPLLQSIPVPAETLEMLLVKKVKDEIVYLNKQRFPRVNVNILRDSGVNSVLIALKAINGFAGTVEGIDINGTPVLASIMPVPGGDVFLIVKMNLTEAYAEIHRMKLLIAVFAVLLILVFTSLISFFWLRQYGVMKGLEIERMLISERYDMLSKYANDAILLYTDDFIILQANDRALEKYGYTRANLLGMNVELISNVKTRDEFSALHLLIISKGGHQYETTHQRKDGSVFPVEISTRYIEILGNNCFLSIIRDITQRKQIERALVESEERLQQITNTIPEIVWTARSDGKFDFVNSRFEAVTGIYPFRENALAESVQPDDLRRITAYWKDAVGDIREHRLQFRLRMKDGSFRWFLCRANPLCDQGGKLIRWFGSITDIDELENRVTQRTAELSDLYNNAPCGYHSLDKNGIYILINETELNWLGYTREDLIGKRTFTDLITPDCRKAFLNNFQQCKSHGSVNNLQYEMIRKDGTILPVLLSATAIKDVNGNILNIRTTIIDHTERKHYENEILKLNQVLQQHGYNLEYANHELEAFSYSVSHDLRAPLRAIKGFSNILMDDYKDKFDEEGLKMLETINDNAHRMGLLINDLLRLSHTSRLELTYSIVNMEELFRSIMEATKRTVPEQHIHVKLNTVPETFGDLALLKQVISNLLSNAIKFSAKQKNSEIEIGSLDGDKELIYYVKDNGAGFNMKYAPELFGVFRRLHNSDDYEGTGVGLALVKRIIDKHGGRVWAESEPDKGSTFYFSLPVNIEK